MTTTTDSFGLLLHIRHKNLSVKRVAAIASMSVPRTIKALAGDAPWTVGTLAFLTRWAEGLPEPPVAEGVSKNPHRSKYRAAARADIEATAASEQRRSAEDTAARETRMRAEHNPDGSTDYTIIAKSAEAVLAGSDALKGVRYGKS